MAREKELRRSLAVFPIGTVMKLTDLTARQIRYYEDQGLIQPERTAGNRRMYSLNDMDRLLEIKDFLNDGYNIAAIKHEYEKRKIRVQQKRVALTDADVRRILHDELLQQGRFTTPSQQFGNLRISLRFELLFLVFIKETPIMAITAADIRREVKEKNVTFLRLMFSDILGIMKNVEIPATDEQLDKVLSNKVMFDGSSIEGFVRINESDMYLYPDLDTWTVFPWGDENGSVAGLICDIYTSAGEPFAGDPRGNLKKALRHMEEVGYKSFNLGPEPEFFLLKLDEQGNPTLEVNDKGGYFDLAPTDLADNTRREIVNVLTEMGFEVEASHHEVGVGQHEIDFKYTEVLKACDNIQIFKLVVKTIARKHGLYATFMAKPKYGIAGSGMHCNMSLFTEEGNAFFDPEDPHGMQLSQDAYYFLGGLMKHAYNYTAIINPTVNSYKRLVPGYEAPVYIAWAGSNRSPLIRVPASRGMGTRLELRSVDPMANPYLAMAVLLEAGLDGIINKIEAPAPIETNIYSMSPEERKEAGIIDLPSTLRNALKALETDEVVRQALGNHIYTNFLDAKRLEWASYATFVSQWEIDNYLDLY